MAVEYYKNVLILLLISASTCSAATLTRTEYRQLSAFVEGVGKTVQTMLSDIQGSVQSAFNTIRGIFSVQPLQQQRPSPGVFQTLLTNVGINTDAITSMAQNFITTTTDWVNRTFYGHNRQITGRSASKNQEQTSSIHELQQERPEDVQEKEELTSNKERSYLRRQKLQQERSDYVQKKEKFSPDDKQSHSIQHKPQHEDSEDVQENQQLQPSKEQSYQMGGTKQKNLEDFLQTKEGYYFDKVKRQSTRDNKKKQHKKHTDQNRSGGDCSRLLSCQLKPLLRSPGWSQRQQQLEHLTIETAQLLVQQLSQSLAGRSPKLAAKYKLHLLRCRQVFPQCSA